MAIKQNLNSDLDLKLRFKAYISRPGWCKDTWKMLTQNNALTSLSATLYRTGVQET